MVINQADLEELRQIYLKHYGSLLTDEQVQDLGIKLIKLFRVIARPIPQAQVDKEEVKK